MGSGRTAPKPSAKSSSMGRPDQKYESQKFSKFSVKKLLTTFRAETIVLVEEAQRVAEEFP